MTSQHFSVLHVAAALLLGSLAAPAHAQTVVLDTYGSDISYLDGWPTPLLEGNSIAVPFELVSDATVQSLLTAIERNPEWESTGGVTLGIASRQGAVPTEAAWLYSTYLDNPLVNTTVMPTGWNLSAGNYWLVATADAGFAGQWISATQEYGGNWAYTTAPGAWAKQTSAFLGLPGARITVSAVPEPTTYGLMFAGGLLVAAAARRKSAQRQQG